MSNNPVPGPPAPAPSATGPVRPFLGPGGVLDEELGAIRERREAIGSRTPVQDLKLPVWKPSSAESIAAADPYAKAHTTRPLGVALSGGGIRSATFNLGVMQGLAEFGLVPFVDYLSTVSGGGYIGSWLHGVIKRCGEMAPRPVGGGDAAARDVVALAVSILSPADHPVPGPPQEDPISFLRKFSNYLAPRRGLFSVDTWVIGCIWLRNVLLNQLLLLPVMAAVALVAILLGSLEHLTLSAVHATGFANQWASIAAGAAAFVIASLPLVVAMRLTARILSTVVDRTFPAKRPKRAQTTAADEDRFVLRGTQYVVALMLVGTIILGWTAPGGDRTGQIANLGLVFAIFLMLALFQYTGGFPDCYRERHPNASVRWPIFWMSLLSAGVAYGLIWLVWYRIPWGAAGPAEAWTRVTFGPPLMCLSLLGGGTLLTGLMGADYPDAAREWMARVASAVFLRAITISAVLLIAVFGPWAFASLLSSSYSSVGTTAIGAWVATTISGVIAGRSEQTDGRPSTRRFSWNWLVAIAPPAFVIGYLLLVATGVHVAVRKTGVWPRTPEQTAAAAPVAVRLEVVGGAGVTVQVADAPKDGRRNWLVASAATFADNYWNVLASVREPGPQDGNGAITNGRLSRLWIVRLVWIGLFLALCATVTTIASVRININEFSMHNFYKNRLVRCYLGASNSALRHPNAYTGFDPKDDLLLAHLKPASRYYGPYAILNAALNLNAGSELAQQERKAASFVFTPAYCGFSPSRAKEITLDSGFSPYGYRETKGYSHPDGLHIGTAMAISGAAANPSSGHTTSAAMAFLLTVFDARLGWWLGNPRHDAASKLPGPLFALKYLLYELLAQTTGTTEFVNLSDGGHFDNLGLYELVRRRCRYIIIGDAEQDAGFTFEGLGAAIRKCRADFGVEIDLSPDPIRLGEKGFSETHCVVGSITYPEKDLGVPSPFCHGPSKLHNDRARGWILYLKASLTGDEPTDVIEYRSRDKHFPHQTTADQFFEESQFESYRRLGLHVARSAFEGIAFDPAKSDAAILDTFQRLAQNWYPQVPSASDEAVRLTDAYTALLRRAADERDLEGFVAQLLQAPVAQSAGAGPAAQIPLSPRAKAFLLEAIQLMENVFTAYNLEHEINRTNPRVAGWLTVFTRWSATPSLQQMWREAKGDYNPLFQQFIDEELARATDVPPRL
jgi:hypothetical protein